MVPDNRFTLNVQTFSQTALQRRVRRAGDEQMIHQRLDVADCYVTAGRISSTGLVHICLSQTW